jgi:hypothetical protein
MLYKGFKPYDFQKQIIDDILNKDDMFYTMVCGRQIGKTLLLINMLLYYGINALSLPYFGYLLITQWL